MKEVMFLFNSTIFIERHRCYFLMWYVKTYRMYIYTTNPPTANILEVIYA